MEVVTLIPFHGICFGNPQLTEMSFISDLNVNDDERPATAHALVLRFFSSTENLHDLLRDELRRVLKRKMARVQQMELRLGNIAQIGLGSLNRKEGIILSPYDQRLRLMAAKEPMPLVVVFEVFLVVVKKIQLDGII